MIIKQLPEDFIVKEIRLIKEKERFMIEKEKERVAQACLCLNSKSCWEVD